jgi:hypothetical protein
VQQDIEVYEVHRVHEEWLVQQDDEAQSCSEMIKLNRKKEKQKRKHKVTKNIKSCD